MIQQQKTYGKILTLTKDLYTVDLLCCFIMDLGFSFSSHDNQAALLAEFEKEGADLLMVDLASDTKLGFELLSYFGHSSPDVPIISLVSSDQKDILNSLRLGAWDCIEKSAKNLPQIEHAICKALERARIIHENKMYRYQLEDINEKLQTSLQELEFDQIAGKSVQEHIFPDENMRIEPYDFSSKILPSLYLSGDMVDYFQIDTHKVGFYIADVSGHGASSAFVTVMLKVLLDQILQDYNKHSKQTILHPKEVLKTVNRYIKQASLGKYLTMVFCVLDTQTHNLTYSIAGHHPSPIMVSANQVTFLEGKGFAVGMVGDVEFDEYQILFPEDGLLTLFSDGLMEEIEGSSLKEKEAKLIKCMHANITVGEMLAYLKLDTIREHPDDVTLLYINRRTS
jgi:sigma-B regulation protein RsbU (phosphoserine phosphatase)